MAKKEVDGFARPEDHATGNFQKPQSPESQHDTKYDNDTPDGWLRGNPATAKPSFDKQNAWRGGKLREG